MVIFYRELLHLLVEVHQKHGTNIDSFQMAMGERGWFIVGCYLEPDASYYIERVVRST